jgi:hypothetical protein
MDSGDEEQNDLFWDEGTHMWLRRSGAARWRQILAERAAWREAHPEQRRALLTRLGLDPDRPVRRFYRDGRPEG